MLLAFHANDGSICVWEKIADGYLQERSSFPRARLKENGTPTRPGCATRCSLCWDSFCLWSSCPTPTAAAAAHTCMQPRAKASSVFCEGSCDCCTRCMRCGQTGSTTPGRIVRTTPPRRRAGFADMMTCLFECKSFSTSCARLSLSSPIRCPVPPRQQRERKKSFLRSLTPNPERKEDRRDPNLGTNLARGGARGGVVRGPGSGRERWETSRMKGSRGRAWATKCKRWESGRSQQQWCVFPSLRGSHVRAGLLMSHTIRECSLKRFSTATTVVCGRHFLLRSHRFVLAAPRVAHIGEPLVSL